VKLLRFITQKIKTFGVETLNTVEETKDKAQARAKEDITVVVSGEK
ncbi:hydroxyethylthiazole kinase (partial), partial [Hyalomma marginatum]